VQVDGLLETVKKLADAADYELDTGTHVLHTTSPVKRSSAKSHLSLYHSNGIVCMLGSFICPSVCLSVTFELNLTDVNPTLLHNRQHYVS